MSSRPDCVVQLRTSWKAHKTMQGWQNKLERHDSCIDEDLA
jgi:hypothetical protein